MKQEPIKLMDGTRVYHLQLGTRHIKLSLPPTYQWDKDYGASGLTPQEWLNGYAMEDLYAIKVKS